MPQTPLGPIKPEAGGESVMLNTRVRPEIRRILHKVAAMEYVGLGDLVCEGIAKVLLERLEDPDFMVRFDAFSQQQLDEIRAQYAWIDTIIATES